ncbi:MAG: tetratricopeptide repeat protein [Acidobacteria bacterium]|nr:tetratricopeptide repeat protein [Acidobacteriota bacterium]
MKVSILGVLLFLFAVGIVLCATPESAFAQNSINGIVFDPAGKPVNNIDVDLLDDLERQIASRKTRGSGLYSFQGLNRGIYYIKVRVGGTGFKEKKIRIDLGTGTATSVEVRQLDIRLELERKSGVNLSVANEVIFAQSVPPEAKDHFEKGMRSINGKDLGQAAEHLVKAITIFPDYFDALFELGNLYLDQKKFVEAEATLERAASVNPKSFGSFFGLGVAEHNLKKRTDAIRNLRKANEIDPNSINAHLLLGIVLRDAKMIEDSEKTLLEAKALSDNRVPEVHWNLALLYYHDLKKYSVAADELDLYIQAIPKDQKKEYKEKISQVKELIKTFRAKAGERS